MLRIIISCLFILLFVQNSFGQSLRTLSMGNISYAVSDEDNELTPYNFGGNPAWFYKDEIVSWLKIIPSNMNEWGDYKKPYMPGRRNNYAVTFRGVKTLGKDGTFLGETSYLYEIRKSVKRSLKYDPYFGGAFFFNDTSTGNFRYDGPAVKFMYGLEIFPGFFGGASVNYGILNGLKNIYTRSESHIREVGGNIGLAYQFSENFLLAANYIMSDFLEKITAKSEDLLEVENYYYRGETFAVKKRSSSVDEKIKRNFDQAGMQLYLHPTESIEIAGAASFRRDQELILIPYVKENESFREFEEGNAKFYTYNAKGTLRYFATDKLTIGFNTEFNDRNSWSKNSDKNLLLWEWKLSGFSAGIGAAYKLFNKTLLSAEYSFASYKSDSSKYIDSRFTITETADHQIRFGAEYQLTTGTFLRAGYNYSKIENDFIFGGKDVSFNRATLGAEVEIFEAITLELFTSYSFLTPSIGKTERAWFDSIVSLKLLNF